MKIDKDGDLVRIETPWLKFADPGGGEATFDFSAPATLVCVRCLRSNLDVSCLTGTCTPTAPQVRASTPAGDPEA